MLVNYAAVALGALFGVFARIFATKWMKQLWHGPFPLATFVINLSGAFALGFITAIGFSKPLALLAGTGFIGTYTTFSTLMVESFELMRRKQRVFFWIYIGGSYVFGMMAVFSGLLLGSRLN
ncbi:fluoride efflux transporter FluC [Sporolactobacillus spathodeae]|uniref:Fluoride-specific ion channel FluC n=1 Tax=Sporolactobacillus spathodeae TaxID=1465502 RepID=A0ABS2Q7B4_9BACL|nr:CrcB family protein [Sporolactobacillus spathodeae]MBM7657681.1 CrcB protein [Sporolactobacillus spathodeae]